MRKYGRAISRSLLFLLGAIGCSHPDPEPPAPDVDAGINGICQRVWVGGGKHRLKNPIRQPYPDATIGLQSLATGKVLYRGRPDTAGEFRIQARPGTYRLVITHDKELKYLAGLDFDWSGRRAGEPGMEDVVEVAPGKFTKVEIMVRESES